ncbi:MAG TPA: T9SS type A sorting domain-containing protein [Bacteroidia bacterium]|jgi:hypothetical protein|nr:T9SS type A sorting domain-containing protein [Bacteroidia bacterium]
MKLIYKILFVLICCVSLDASAQEYLRPLNGNINLIYRNPQNSPNQNSQQEKLFIKQDTIPFFEDFYYAPDSPYPTAKHWLDSNVYVNTGFAIAPPSIGVATFDGLDKNGYPYNITATPATSDMADVLTSRPINLYSNPNKTYFYSPLDSLGISFLYQARGFGENPAVNDSLILEFFKPLQPIISGTSTIGYGVWNAAWGIRGNNSPPPNDTIFKKGFVRISDTAYFHIGFQFRFRNRATLAGSVDHWQLDYIDLRVNHYKTDTSYNDLTFGYMPRNILKNYTTMPYYQYKASEMDTSFTNFIRNNNVGQVKNTNYEYSIYNSAMTLLSSYGTGSGNTSNVNPFCTRGWDSVLTHRNPPLNYTLTMSPLTKDTLFYIKHIVHNTTPDFWKYNDTILQKIEFNNFYAYDDGSAESAYYLNTYGAKNAIKFALNVSDTLRALDIFFDPFTDGNLVKTSSFRMCVWNDGGGQPGTIIRRDSAMYPKYLDFGYNKIPRYFFTTPMILSPGTYYIGMQQTTNQPLYVGFDRNLDHMTKLYYDVTGSWQQSGIPGSLMIHPVMGEATHAMVGINEPTVKKQKESVIKVYPNPASDKLFISASSLNSSDDYKIELYSIVGDKLFEIRVENTTTEVNLDEFASGIYFVALIQNRNTISTQKFIISR